MFLVFNKGKIISYIVALSTIAILFAGASFFVPNEDGIIQTSAKASKLLPIYSVDIQEKKVSLCRSDGAYTRYHKEEAAASALQ